MFDWLSGLLAKMAYDAAISSAGQASYGGVYQMKEPEELQRVAKEDKERTKAVH